MVNAVLDSNNCMETNSFSFKYLKEKMCHITIDSIPYVGYTIYGGINSTTGLCQLIVAMY